MSDSNFIFDTTDQQFSDDVILASDNTPILIDFWAPWCGPCQMLSPVLEELVKHFDGKLRVAKVNTDENPALSQHFQIRGIPALKLIKDREIVFETGGVQPLAALIEAITPFVDDGSALTDPVNSVNETPEEEIEHNELSPEEAIAALESALADNSENPELNYQYLQALVMTSQLDKASEHFHQLATEIRETEEAQRLNTLIDFSRARAQAPTIDELEAALSNEPTDLVARYQYGVHKLLDGHAEAALQDFLTIVKTNNDYEDGLGRKAMIAAFTLIQDADLVKTFRRKMANYLH